MTEDQKLTQNQDDEFTSALARQVRAINKQARDSEQWSLQKHIDVLDIRIQHLQDLKKRLQAWRKS